MFCIKKYYDNFTARFEFWLLQELGLLTISFSFFSFLGFLLQEPFFSGLQWSRDSCSWDLFLPG